MGKISKLKIFLQKNYANVQSFNTRNTMGDYIETVYDEDGIQVYYAPAYDYIEIFGLTEKQFNSLLDKKSFLKSHLKNI